MSVMEELLTMALPETTTERLLAVADLIESEPERYDQTFYFNTAGNIDVLIEEVIAGQGYVVCESTACIAGWGVVLSPAALTADYPKDGDDLWEVAGAEALGLEGTLAICLFDPTFRMPIPEVADILRRLAKIPEGDRDIRHAHEVLTDEQVHVLLRGFLVDEVL